MNDFINKLYKNNAIIYKVLLFLITVVSIVYLFPKGGQFKYDYPQGKPWQYDNFYAPFDFAIQKTADEIDKETREVRSNVKKYFVYNDKIENQVLDSYVSKIIPSDSLSVIDVGVLKKLGKRIINKIYKYGFLDDASVNKANRGEIIILRKGNSIDDISFSRLIQSKDILKFISENANSIDTYKQNILLNGLSEALKSNVTYDTKYSNKELNEALKSISYAKGKVSKAEINNIKRRYCRGKEIQCIKIVRNSFKFSNLDKIKFILDCIWLYHFSRFSITNVIAFP